MRAATLALAAIASLAFAQSTISTVTAPSARIVTDDPPAAHYIAIFPQAGSQNIEGLCAAETPTNTTTGTLFTFNINGALQSGGNFLYHIHEYPVPSNGSCDATGDHLDPENRGESPPCDASQPQTCQVGDLAGKHGNIPALPGFSAQYIDDYVSLNPNNPAFMGNRSLVIHFYNGTRYACANWVAVNATNLTPATTTAITGSAHTSITAATSHPITPTSMVNSTKSGAEVAHAAMLKNVIGLIPVLATLAFAIA